MNDSTRRIVFATFVLGLTGLTAELLLLGHDEDALQLVPLVLAACGAASLAHVIVGRSAEAIRGFRVVMGLFVLAGLVGAILHFRANVEFQQEAAPDIAGWALVSKALRAKAPPALAPGAMVQLGLIGFVYALNHPNSSRSRP
jgi:hypothetical protein